MTNPTARIPLGCAIWLAGCGTDTDTADPSPLDTGLAAVCVDAPVITWENFGAGFVLENCQSCHASTSPNRNGAPSEVTFDDKDTALTRADALLRVVTSEAPTMPPEGGVTDDDRWRVEVWLTCWE